MSWRVWRARVLRIATSLALLTSGERPAHAADRAQDGRALFEAGVKSYEDGRYEAAVAAFQEAYRLTQRQGLLFSIAQALRRSYETTHDADQLRDAIRYYERYLSTRPGGDRRAEAEGWLEQLGSRPDAKPPPQPRPESEGHAQLVVAVNVKSAKLTLDGREVASLPHAAQVTPGKHRILVTAEGYVTYQSVIEVAANAVLPLNIELRRATSRIEVTGNDGAEVLLDGVRVAVLPSAGFQASPGHHALEVRQAGRLTLRQTVTLGADGPLRLRLVGAPTTRRLASFGLMGGGIAAVAAGGVLGYLALQKQADARALQEPGMGPAFEDALAERNDLRLAAVLAAGAGAAAVLGGTLSLATEGFGPPRSVNASRRELRYHLSLAGLAFSGQF